MESRDNLPPHPLPADADIFLKSCSPQEQQLYKMAIQQLGSSYFMDKCHGYRQWKAKQGTDSNKK